MNTTLKSAHQQKNLTRKDVLTPEEIKQFEKTLTLKKAKKGAVVAVGTSSILISSIHASADFTAIVLPKSIFEKKTENVMMAEAPKAPIELVQKEAKEVVPKTEEKIEVVTPVKTVVKNFTLADAKAQSEKAIEENIDSLPISDHEVEFLNAIKAGAFDSWKEYGILPSVLTAQAILESDWGTSELALFGNALFGVKASNWEGKTYTKRTREVYDGKDVYIDAAFRAYDSWTDSMIDHGKFLNKERYALAIGEKDFKKSISAIFNGGYATDPQYVEKITRVINAYELDKWDKEVIHAHDEFIASIGPSDMDAFVHYLNETTSENRLEKVEALTKEEAIETFKAVGAEKMKKWKNAEMEALFKAFQHERMNTFLHGHYKNKYLDKVAALALVILDEESPTREQENTLRAMEAVIKGQIKAGDLVLTDKAGIEAYIALEEKINNIKTDYASANIPQVRADFSGKVIVLDPGHGGKDPGAGNVYANGVNEAKHNLALVQKLKSTLEAQGATVHLTNDGSTYVELEDRVKLAVEKKADIFFSIHFNSNDDRLAEGTEIFYDRRSTESKQLAKTLFAYQKQALHTVPTRSNGANTGNYEVLRTATAYNVPAILTEALFMSNPYEVLLLENEQVKTSLVNGYVAGLADYFSLDKQETVLKETIEETAEKAVPDEVIPEETQSEETVSNEAPNETNTDTTKTEEPLEETKEIQEVQEVQSEESSETIAETNEKEESFFLFDMFEKFAK